MSWQIIVGAILVLGGVVNIFQSFGAFVFGLLAGGLLIGWGLAKRNTVSKTSPTAYEDIDNQIRALETESNFVKNAADLTPPEFHNQKRRYHYKDVQPVVFWQYGGRYGKSCESIGVKRGDPIRLTPPQQATDDPQDLAINWSGTDIGIMKNNRLRGMVHQWQAANLPVLAAVSFVGGESKLLIEFAFYGSAPK